MSFKSHGFMFLIFVVYLTCVWCEETEVSTESSEDSKLVETGRRRHGFGLHRWWGIYGLHSLAVLYWLKVKAVVVSLIIGTAIIFGFRYFKHSKGCDIVHESPYISYEHGPAWSGSEHDHIPYSLDHNPYEHDHEHDHDHFSSSDIVSDSAPYGALPSDAYTDVAPTASADPASVHGATINRRRGRQLESEEQVSEVMFAFLGIGNKACRRRFICEMEFRSKANPFTRMAFGIVGRGLFSKYTNNNNEKGRATSFRDCARVNPDCVLVEENFNNDSENETVNDEENEARSLEAESRDLEQENEANLKAELENSASQATSTPSAAADPIARAIFSRSQTAN